MKTIEQIKSEILSSNPSRIYIINDEEFVMTDIEFEKAINDRAEMEYAQYLAESAKIEAEAKRQALLDKLGITKDEAKLLLGGN